MTIVYLDGAFLPAEEARISPEDRGFLLGDGVFDTLRTYDGVIFRYDDHARRLFNGLDQVRIPAPFDADALRSILSALVARNGGKDLVLRVTITRGKGAGGYARRKDERPTVYISGRAIPDVALMRSEGVELALSPIPRPLPFLSVVKTTSLGAMALARVLTDAYETILLDAQGHIAEGAASTLYAIKDGAILTPPGDLLLPATTRIVIGECATLAERRMTVEEYLGADALFLSATSTGPIPVRRVGDRAYPVDHPVYTTLIADYDRIVDDEIRRSRS